MKIDGTDYKLLFEGTAHDIVLSDDIDGEVMFAASDVPVIVECLLEMVRELPDSDAKEAILVENTERLSPAPAWKERRRQRRIWRGQKP